MEIAQAQLCREIFPRAPLKYMPPQALPGYFNAYLVNGMFNLVSILTGREIQLWDADRSNPYSFISVVA